MTVVEGERTFAAPPARVFALLTDPDVVAAALPGVRGHTTLDADHWEAKVKPPFPFVPSMTIRFEVVERREPEHAALVARGGGVDVRSTFDLEPTAEGTSMRWRTDVAGRFVGPGFEAIARRQADRMLDAVERAL